MHTDDLALLRSAAQEASDIALEYYARALKPTRKPDGSNVTEADLAIDAHLKQRLLAARPAYGWLSEESADDHSRLACRRVFIVDPIDGTNGFIRREPHWTICVSLIEDGAPLAGVIINPVKGETFAAIRGSGATLNGQRLQAQARTGLSGARFVGPASAFRQRAAISPWPAHTRDYFSSLAYRICSVAAGARDGAISLSLSHEWDIAAAALIAWEAGVSASDLSGAPFRFNQPRPLIAGVIATAPGLYDGVLARVRDLAPAAGPDE